MPIPRFLPTLMIGLLLASACTDDPAKQPVPTVVEHIALQHSFSGDGSTVVAIFSEPLDAATVTPADFTVESDATVATQVTAATVSDDRVTLTLDTPLDKSVAHTLVVADVRDAQSRRMLADKRRVPIAGTLHLGIVWHQHQPVYIDPRGDYLRGPWVRKHGTKDYYDMAAMLQDYPAIHLMVNLTPVLLMQLQNYYLDRIGPYVDLDAGSIDVNAYFSQRPAGVTTPVTDPWIDQLLTATPMPQDLTAEDRGWFYEDVWSTFSISETMIARFPAYKALLDKRDSKPESFTQDDLLQMKGWFQLAWFDPDFLRGAVSLPSGDSVDLSDLVVENTDGTFTLVAPFSEETCQRLVVEEYKVLANIVGIHKQLLYEPTSKTGQIEVMTTPFYHPILPLLSDTELAKVAMPTTPMPVNRFQQEQDARVHVAKAARMFEELFGQPMTGMWPAEGSVAEAVVPLFAEQGVTWIATDRRVLEASAPADQPIYSPYRLDSDTEVGDAGASDDELAIVFRDTEISDKLGFHYQSRPPEENLADLVESLRRHSPAYGDERLLTIILDGENAWEHYVPDNDAKGFLGGMYATLEAAQLDGEFRTVTVSEYLSGNAARSVTAHVTHDLPELEPLHAGSWIGGNYSIWIGEEEENLAWDYLYQARADLISFGLPRPAVDAPVPTVDSVEWHTFKAWESLYAAEGSDWFWWYGADQTAMGGDEPFDEIFRELLKSIYRHAQQAGVNTSVPDLPPIVRLCRPPRSTLVFPPTVDGEFVPDNAGDPKLPNEWTAVGAGVCMDIDSGAVHDVNDDVATYYHGLSANAFYLALDMNEDLQAKLNTDYQIRLYFSHKHILSLAEGTSEQDPFLATTRLGDDIRSDAGGAAREVVIDFSGGDAVAQIAAVSGGQWSPPSDAAEVTIGGPLVSSSVLELKVPLALLNYQADDPLELLVVVSENDGEIDRLPNGNSLVLFPDRLSLVELTFVVDVRGTRIALDAVSNVANPPAPAGTGTVFIVGELPAFGNWTPNVVAMADDGDTYGDAVAGDNLWTFSTQVSPLTDVQYKYTIGGEGEGWGGTEEFPLTNRGFIVSDRNGDRQMELHDVFADRPAPSGSLADLTEVVND